MEAEELINSDGVSFHYIVKYTAKSTESLPESDTDSKLKEI
jgi:hypothetical protein